MNVLFLSLGKYKTIDQPGIYTDLLRKFAKHGHSVYVLSSVEARDDEVTGVIYNNNCTIIRVFTGDIQKTSVIKKGINTLLIEIRYKKAIKRYLSNVKFDLVLYPTPPITFVDVVEFVKNRDSARTYLMLKDIFPQNAVDIGMMQTTGIKGLIYKYFRSQEKKLYAISDHIGCMSQANVDYVLKHNPEIDPAIVEICPNSIEVLDKSVDKATQDAIRTRYGIPLDKKVFVYGGNLGKPQGIPFLIDCLKACKDIEEAFFLVVGDGTEYHLIEAYVKTEKPKHVKLMQRLPKEDYDTMIGACDVGLIFLDHRFTIPNFPSRLLSYMQAKLPVLACTDPNTDVGKVIVDGGFGWWCESDDSELLKDTINSIVAFDAAKMRENSFRYLNKNYSVNCSYYQIIAHFEE